MLRIKEIYELWKRDNLLDQALVDSHDMLHRTYAMFLASVKSLRESDVGAIAFDIYEADQKVNHYEREVRRKVLKHLALTGSTNVVPGLILTSIVIDIERIGDYTKNIKELAVAHPKRLVCGVFEEDVKRIEETVSHLFERIAPTLEASDQDTARDLIEGATWIKKKCDEIDHELIQEKDRTLGPGDAVSIALYVRYLKRIGAHLMNALSSVINPFDRIGFSPSGEDDT
jgi:phosphate uptake regulator